MQEDNNAQPVEQGPVETPSTTERRWVERDKLAFIAAMMSFSSIVAVVVIATAVVIFLGALGTLIGNATGNKPSGMWVGLAIVIAAAVVLGGAHLLPIAGGVPLFHTLAFGFVIWQAIAVRNSGKAFSKTMVWSIVLASVALAVAALLLNAGAFHQSN